MSLSKMHISLFLSPLETLHAERERGKKTEEKSEFPANIDNVPKWSKCRGNFNFFEKKVPKSYIKRK